MPSAALNSIEQNPTLRHPWPTPSLRNPQPENEGDSRQGGDANTSRSEDPATELEELLREIEHTRNYNPALDKGKAALPEEENHPDRTLIPLKSRPKMKCWFGPRSRRGLSLPLASEPGDNELSPPTAPDRLPCDNHNAGATVRTTIPLPATPTALGVPGFPRTDRVTLTLPHPSKRSPLDAHKLLPANQDRPNPHRFVLQRLGLTEQAFDARVTLELNEFLREQREERRLAHLFPPASTSSQTPRILTKEDCMQLFRVTGVPTSGSLLGVYRWAANLSEAEFDFEANFDPDSIALLDACD